ncbi:uncharacterized protein LOC106663557 [Cimex lectularius]|uniref:SANTA domain-containing protein n=1 Tax=Cimex lectularius TaxID=79782 RepID=A0A8I6SJN4_CIMLE|nr:uncharacterized protein LOC106663557 [Cimex lectularius]
MRRVYFRSPTVMRETTEAKPRQPKISKQICENSITQMQEQNLVKLDKLQKVMGPTAFAVLCCEITKELERYMEKRYQNTTTKINDYHNSSSYSASVFQFPQFVQNFLPSNEIAEPQFKKPASPVIQSSLTRCSAFTHPGDQTIQYGSAEVQKSNCNQLTRSEGTFLKPLPVLKNKQSVKTANCKQTDAARERKVNQEKKTDQFSEFDLSNCFPTKKSQKRKLEETKSVKRASKNDSKTRTESSGFETPSPFRSNQPKKRKLIEEESVNKTHSNTRADSSGFETPSPYPTKKSQKSKLIEAKRLNKDNSKTRADSSGFETPSPYPTKKSQKSKLIEAKKLNKDNSKTRADSSGFETPSPYPSKKSQKSKSIEAKKLNKDNSKTRADSSGFETPSPYPTKKSQKSKVSDVKKGKRLSKDPSSDLANKKSTSPIANFLLKNWTILLVNNCLRLMGNKYSIDNLKLLEKSFITGAIESVKKVDGNSIVKASKMTYCLIGELNDYKNELPPEVKQLCGNGFPSQWKKLLTFWKSLDPKSKEQTPVMKETSKNERKNEDMGMKAKKITNSIFEQVMENDSFMCNRAVTPSALLRSVEKLNTSFNKELTPPTMFISKIFDRNQE